MRVSYNSDWLERHKIIHIERFFKFLCGMKMIQFGLRIDQNQYNDVVV